MIYLGPLRSIIAIGVIAFAALAAPAIAESELISAEEAYRIIDAGAYGYRRHPAYTAVSYQAQGRETVITTERVRNISSGRRLVRVERKIGDETTTYLCNSKGNWATKNGRASRVNTVPELWRTIPLRLQSTRVGNVSELRFSRHRGDEYAGVPIITVSVEMSSNMAAHAEGNSPSVSRESAGPQQRFEYFLDEKSGALLGWRSYLPDGSTAREIGYQEFTITDVPESLFELPQDVTVVMPESAEAARELFGTD